MLPAIQAGGFQKMRALLALAAYAALTVFAFAQPPSEVAESDTIKLYPGDSVVVRFDRPVKDLKFSDEIVHVVPESDQTVLFRALKPGTAIMSAFAPNGDVFRRSRIVVAGGMVRIYGNQSKERGEASDFVGYVCSDIGCGRADAEVERQTISSVARTRTNSRGDVITTTKQY